MCTPCFQQAQESLGSCASKVRAYATPAPPTEEQLARDTHLTCSRIAAVVAIFFAILSIVFLCLALNPKRSLNLLLPLSAASSGAAVLSLCIRTICMTPPKAPPIPKKKKAKQSDSSSTTPAHSPTGTPKVRTKANGPRIEVVNNSDAEERK